MLSACRWPTRKRRQSEGVRAWHNSTRLPSSRDVDHEADCGGTKGSSHLAESAQMRHEQRGKTDVVDREEQATSLMPARGGGVMCPLASA